jgi:O6-methylguanine-DNA--protein-cysteine methyltransferase
MAQTQLPSWFHAHRVIGADASLTGYGAGIDCKRWLLTREGAACESVPTRRMSKAA